MLNTTLFCAFFLLFLKTLTISAQFVSFQPTGVPFRVPVTVSPLLTAQVLFSNLTTPRGIAIDERQNVLVIERGLGVTIFHAETGGWARKLLVPNLNVTQGIQVAKSGGTGKLYVSTSSQLLVYTYSFDTREQTAAIPIVLVDGLPSDGDLLTHTIQLLNGGSDILVATGPKTNVDITARDPNSGRSQVRSFRTTAKTTTQWLSGTLVAYGIRNPAGMATNEKGLWIVENAASIDAGLGAGTNFSAAFVNDNPADELEFVAPEKLGKSYGFPDCTTLWNGTADPAGEPAFVTKPTGTQFSLGLGSGRDDSWCQKRDNNVPPALNFQAHSVPLDIKFYTASSVVLPWAGDAFVTFHGSFNRVPPTGYGVVHVPFINGKPKSQDYEFVIQATGLAVFRPVGLVFGADGRLYGTSDTSGELYVLEKK